MFEINEYVNSRKALKQGCHKDLKTKFPDFSLSSTKILTKVSPDQLQAILEMTDTKNTRDSQSEKIKNIFQKYFKNKGLDIIVNCNMKIVNYLVVDTSFIKRQMRGTSSDNE